MSEKVRLRTTGGGAYLCPCGDIHSFDGKWKFNGDSEKPTLEPSMLVRSGHYVPGYDANGKDTCWCTYVKEHPEEANQHFTCYRCHSFVRNGLVDFLPDCTHKLSGQKGVPLPDWPY